MIVEVLTRNEWVKDFVPPAGMDLVRVEPVRGYSLSKLIIETNEKKLRGGKPIFKKDEVHP